MWATSQNLLVNSDGWSLHVYDGTQVITNDTPPAQTLRTTLDGARRVASLLSNALTFANAFTSQHKEVLAEQPTLVNAPSTSSP